MNSVWAKAKFSLSIIILLHSDHNILLWYLYPKLKAFGKLVLLFSQVHYQKKNIVICYCSLLAFCWHFSGGAKTDDCQKSPSSNKAEIKIESDILLFLNFSKKILCNIHILFVKKIWFVEFPVTTMYQSKSSLYFWSKQFPFYEVDDASATLDFSQLSYFIKCKLQQSFLKAKCYFLKYEDVKKIT